MPETVGALILTAAGAAEITGIAGLGTLAGTTVAGVSLASIVGVSVIVGTSIGLSYALKPDLPKPEDGSQAVRQAIPSRIRGYGTCRLAGAYMLFEAGGSAPARSYDVIAFHSGRIGSIISIYLSDDSVVLNADINTGSVCTVIATGAPDGRYLGAMTIEARLGDASQIALASLTGDPSINSTWTSNHKGNGIAQLGVVAAGLPDPSAHTETYPKGRPEASVVANCSPCWDPRMGHDRNNPNTWASTTNPVIQLIDYLTRLDGGMGLDYKSLIEPVLDEWMDQASICDQVVGDTVRYSSSGWFAFDNKPEDIINKILSTCDGWLTNDVDGTLKIKVGQYGLPTDPPITQEYIYGFNIDCGLPDEELINQLEVTYTDQTEKFVSSQISPVRDEESISATGIVRSKPLDLSWVQNPVTAERLARRALLRLNPRKTGSLATTLYGMRWLGKRWVRLRLPGISGLEDCVVEIQDAETDLMGGTVTFKWNLVDTEALLAL